MASDPEEEEEDDMIDGGWGWVVVAASFMAHVIGDGCGFSFGILFSELLEAFGESKSTTAWVGSLFVSVPAICGPIASLCAKYMGCRCTTMLGGVVAALGCFAGSFSRNIGELCVSFGVIAGFGLSLVFVPAVVIVAFYFEKKRAFATGIAVAGSGIGTMIFAPITELLLQHYQWRGTLLICSAVLLNTVVCGAIFRPLKAEKEAVKKRKDSARNSDRSRSVKNCERNSHSNAHSNKEPHKSCDGNTHKHCCTQTHKTNCKNTPCKKHCNKNTCDKHLHSNPKSHRNKADDDDDVFIDDDSLTVKMLSRLTKLSAMSKQSGLSRLSEVSDSSDHVTRLYRSVPVLADVTKNEIKKSVYSGLAETANNNDDDDKTKLENKKNNKDENNNNNKTNQNFNVIEGTPSKVMTSSLPSLTPSELYPLLIHRQSLCVHKDVKKNLSIKNDFQNQKQLGAFVEIQNNLAQINTKKNGNNNNNKYNNINKNNKNNNRTTYNGNINDKRLPSNSHSTTNQLKQVKIDLLTPNKDLTSNFKALLTQYNIKPDPENLNFDLNINPTITINNISLNLKVKPSSTQNDVKLFQDKSEPRTALFKMAKNTLIPPHNMVPKSNMTARPCLRRGDMVYRGSLLRANFFSRITKSSSCPEVCLTPKKKYKKSKKQKLLSFFRSTKSSDSDKLSYQRIKIKLGHKCKEVMDLSLFRNSAFCLFNIHTILLYLSCDIPYLYSPNRATLIGIHHSSASYLVSIIGFFSMIGQILMGYLGDHPCINVTTFYNVTIAIAGVFVALIPHTFAFTTIALFHAAYGFFSSSNFALTTVILVELLGMDRLTDAFGIVSMSQGIANLLGPPIAGWLSDISSSYDMSFYLAGVMILISGLMLFSAPCLKRFDGEEEDESSDEDGNCSCCDGCCSCDSGEVGDDGFEDVEGGGDGEDGRDGGFDDGENMVVVKIKKASEEKDNNNDKNNKNKIKKNDNLTGNIDKRTDNDVNNNNSKNNSTENNKNENNNKNNTNNDNNNNVVVIIMNNGISHTKMKKMKNLI